MRFKADAFRGKYGRATSSRLCSSRADQQKYLEKTHLNHLIINKSSPEGLIQHNEALPTDVIFSNSIGEHCIYARMERNTRYARKSPT